MKMRLAIRITLAVVGLGLIGGGLWLWDRALALTVVGGLIWVDLFVGSLRRKA